MAIKDAKARDEDERDDEDDDPDAGVPIAEAPPAARSAAAKAKAKAWAPKDGPGTGKGAAGRVASGKVAHGAKGHGHDPHGHDHTEDEAQDPSWWIPYAVLGGLVLVGVFGFFGAFNPWLKPKFGPMPVSSSAPATTTQAAAAPATPAPAPPPQALPADTFGAKHILVFHKDSRRAPPGTTRTKEEALARAKEAMVKARAPGAKFEDLVKEYSEEPKAAERGGNLGNFRKGAMVKEFQDGLEKTKVGEVSDVVETPFGYHVILRTK